MCKGRRTTGQGLIRDKESERGSREEGNIEWERKVGGKGDLLAPLSLVTSANVVCGYHILCRLCVAPVEEYHLQHLPLLFQPARLFIEIRF